MSTSFPLPSSPHCVPRTVTTCASGLPTEGTAAAAEHASERRAVGAALARIVGLRAGAARGGDLRPREEIMLRVLHAVDVFVIESEGGGEET